MGLLWAAWHLLVYLWGSGDPTGAFSFAIFLPEFVFLIGVLPVYRVLMVWVYDHTESVLVALLMHASLTACTTAILVPPAMETPRIAYYLVLAVVLWLATAAVVVTNGGRLARPDNPPTGIGSPQPTSR